MKILLIMDPGIAVPPQKYGGIERIVYLLANQYILQGHQVTLLAGPGSYCNGETITYGANEMERSGIEKSKELLFVWNYLLRNKHKYDLVHNFGRLIYLLPVLNNPVKKIMSYQRPVTVRGIKVANTLPNKNLYFTACSDYCVSTGNVAGKWQTVYNTLDFNQYQLNENIAEDAPLMFLGRLDKVKGVHIAIKVAKATGNKLIIGGNISHTEDNYHYFKTEIEPNIDNKQIIYLGALNDEEKNHYLGQAKAMLFPIEWDEPFGIVMIEAMACGTPVIAFNRGSVPEVVEDRVNGFRVNNADEMISAVNHLQNFDRQNCRESARSNFNIDKIAKQYIDLVTN